MKISPTTRRFRQRGAIGLMAVLTLLMAILFTALVVDSARLWMQQRKLQAIADIAAIEAARSLDGCESGDGASTLPAVLNAAQIAAQNNGFQGSLASSPNIVDLGRVNTSSGIREFISGDGASAVYVRATQQVPSSLIAGGLFGDNIVLSAEAVSLAASSMASFSAGSFTARLNSEDSVLLNTLLPTILGSPLNLSAVSYEGIAKTRLTLQDLLDAAVDIGNYQELLDTDIQLAELLDLFVEAASQNGTADVQAIAAMQNIANIAVRNLSLTLGDVLAVTTPDPSSAANVDLNALSLIITSILVANGNNAINLPLGVNLASIANINAMITVVEPPRIAVGSPANADGSICTYAETAQVRISVPVSVNIPLLASINLSLNVEVAQGRAELYVIDGIDSTNVHINAHPGIASITLTNTARTGPARITTLLGIPLADIGLDLPLQPPTSETLLFNVDHPARDHLPQQASVNSPLGGSLQNALSQEDTLDITVLGIINLGLLNNVISTIVSPLLGEIGRVLLDPLLKILGIKLGGLDVTLESVQQQQANPLVI